MNRNLKMASTRDVDHTRFAVWPATTRLHIVEPTVRCRPWQNWHRWLTAWAATIAMVVIALTLAISAHASTGDAAFVAGAYTITPSADGSTAIVNVAGIQNTTATTTTGSLGFALWYSTTPYNGGTLNGFQVAASYLPIGQCTSSQLKPSGECVSIAVQATLTPPPAGTYYPVLLLIEHTASCPSSNGYCTDDFVKLLQTSDGSPIVTVGSNTGGSTTGTATSSVSIVGSYSYTADIAAGTAQLDVAEILNASQTYTTGTLRLELWLTLGTYAGGPINGYRIATYQLTGSSNGQLGPNQYFSNISETVPLTNVPGAGTYNVTLLVTEYSNSCTATDHYCVDTYGAFPTNLTIAGGGNAGGNSNISIVGSYSYSTDSNLSTAQLTVAEILNSSPTYKTGTLRLELWLTTSAYAGGSITGNRIATYQLTGTTNGSLGPNQEFNNISASVPLTNLPGAGSYYATLIVSEYTKNCGTSDGYCIDTYGNFSNPFIISAPTTTVATVAAAGGGSGGGSSGGGGCSPIDCLGLALVLLLNRFSHRIRAFSTMHSLTPVLWLAPIAASLALIACGGGGDDSAPAASAPTITMQPTSVTVSSGQPATFSVTAAGTAPLSYQWQLGGANISGANAATYTIPSTTAQDSGQVYSVVVTNTAGSVTSSKATLTIASSSTGSIAVSETSGGTAITTGGAFVLVDGIVAGQLDGSGNASISASPGNHEVTILDSGARGDLSVTVTANQSTPAAIAVIESDAAYVASQETVPQIVGGIFDTTNAANNPVSIMLTDSSGKPISVATLSATLQGQTLPPISLSSNTKVSSGVANIDLDAAINSLGGGTVAAAAADSPLLVQFEALDANGLPYNGTFTFEVGEYIIQGQVSAPPSNPSLPIGDWQLKLTKHNSSAAITVTSSSSGSFTSTGVPPGTYDVAASMVSGAVTYNVFGSLTVAANTSISVVPLSPTDIANGISAITVKSAASTPAKKQSAKDQARRSKIAKATPRWKAGTDAISSTESLQAVPTTGPYGNSISVSADQQDTPVTKSATYTVPAGTTSLDIIYQVCTQEYPTYVDAQSQYNDLWSVNAVDASGNALLSVSHSVNEQLTTQPVWGSNGCTSVIDTPITVTAGSAITLAISTTNIGDDELPTMVTAIVATGGFSIQKFTLQPWKTLSGGACTATPPSTTTSNITVCQSANHGDYLGIPPPGSTNTFARPAMAILQNTGGALPTISTVELDLVDLSGNTLDTLFNEPPGNIVQQPSPGTLTFPITYSGIKTSSVASPPDRVTYLLTVNGSDQSGNTVSATQNLTVFNTLIEATANGVTVDRYGYRDLGGDDWTTQNGVNWLTANSTLLTRFDDISGEHGRNLGHRTHGQGNEIDIFQFVSLNATTGLLNYDALRDAAIKAAAGDTASLQVVANWVSKNRAGIAALMAASNVSYIYSGVGTCYNTLSQGWLQSAMLNGTLLVFNGATSACTAIGPPSTVDLGVGTWTPPGNITFNMVHNSHIHIGLAF